MLLLINCQVVIPHIALKPVISATSFSAHLLFCSLYLCLFFPITKLARPFMLHEKITRM